MEQAIDIREMPQKQRRKMLNKGPGVFSYEGGAFDTENKPAVYRYVIDPKTRAVKMKDGQPVKELISEGELVSTELKTYRYGESVLPDPVDEYGRPVVGDDGKILKGDHVFAYEFPKGKQVFVGDPAVALKLRCLGFMDEHDVDLDDAAAAVGTKVRGKKRGGKKGRKAADVAAGADETED